MSVAPGPAPMPPKGFYKRNPGYRPPAWAGRSHKSGLSALPFIGAAIGLMLMGCSTTPKPRPVESQTQTVEVQVRAPCPDRAERERLRVGRPPRLADQPMPDTARERVAKTTAQLGRYEAPGGWADQVDSALDRCQQP